jgi:hypothetical protein
MSETRRGAWIDSYRIWLERSTNAYRDVFVHGTDKWKGAMTRMDEGSYGQKDAYQDWWDVASKWWDTTTTHLGAFPFALKKVGAVPSVLFVIQPPPDSNRGPTAHDPAYVPLRAQLDPTTEIKASPLVRLGGGTPSPVEGVITLDRDDPWLGIGLQDLLVLGGKPPVSTPSTSAAFKVAPGHYVASVYADTPGNKIPLAVVHLVIEA